MDEEKPDKAHEEPDPSGDLPDAAGYVFGVPQSESSSVPAEATPSEATPTPAETTPNPAETASTPSDAVPTETSVPEDKPSYANLPSTNLPAIVSKDSQSTAGSAGMPPGDQVTLQTSDGSRSIPVTVVTSPDKFAVDDVISFGWRQMLKYFWPLTGVMTCNFLVQTVPAVATTVINYTVAQSAAMSILTGCLSLVGGVAGVIIAFGTFNLYIKVVDGDTIATRDVYSKYARTWNWILASILYFLMVAAGYICFIVPGVYLQLRFQFYTFFIVDSNASPLVALKASWAVTKGALGELFFLGVINYFIGWIGMLCLLIGSFPALLVQNIALARTYRLLRQNTPLSEMPPNLMPAPLISDNEPPVLPS